ncbi:DNA-binding response regulator, OmpR family, contains REC and winged-helix (wHTH) domain [Anaerovirgula multivorans]|uniref:Stage 0 sporulation protein A homolog n=1 Tax=Anaerovirgula multivorans TaxID=312168 RepID=A0A239FJ83_9FIRM|nr:response regulator transcription factor [Anaerovirgula multivorans]SNS56969.1 DNA-binding response regulator, OmpR family, contains REC and winged-helix (wHTH) domain [Anaerovirgula multivorans]
MYKIFIVEDDNTISSIIEEKLNKWGYKTLRVSNFNDILSNYTSFEPHLILMDINLPYYDGFYWCGKIRQLSNVPIIFISSRDTDGDKIRAITQGGDDYIEKPFSMDLLIAKVQAILRRAYSYSDQTLNILQHKDMILDIEHLKVFCGEKEIELTRNECRILSMLIRNHDRLVKRTRLMKALWDDESFVDDNTLTVNVNRLRRKLEMIGLKEYIKTIKGEGYRLI